MTEQTMIVDNREKLPTPTQKTPTQKTPADRQVELSSILKLVANTDASYVPIPAAVISQCSALANMPIMLGHATVCTIRDVAQWQGKTIKSGKNAGTPLYIVFDHGYGTAIVAEIGDYVLKAKVSMFLSPK